MSGDFWNVLRPGRPMKLRDRGQQVLSKESQNNHTKPMDHILKEFQQASETIVLIKHTFFSFHGRDTAHEPLIAKSKRAVPVHHGLVYGYRWVNRLDWPAQSPDLNPTENFWNELGAVNHLKFLKELACLPQAEWKTTPLSTIQTLAESIPRKILTRREQLSSGRFIQEVQPLIPIAQFTRNFFDVLLHLSGVVPCPRVLIRK
ncbi:hypothetical protein TNCV_2628541 [Trichonephila clavipes]|uniref:Tc1-like transposase DDE domain-containing protein n=1 Tax=Trichonephila clavipes TaxID=2585209 RepID=A0A8X6VL41_TRICX|nr:hypothetical protein TNCV_2628541 [Trichonephila clavipes]